MINKFLTFILVLFFYFNQYSYAENKILFIDVEFIYLNSIAGKEINKKIQSDTKKINDELLSLQNEIQKDKDKIMSQKNVLSQEELQKKTIDLEKKAKSYNDRMSKKNNELNIYGNKAKVEFYNQLTKIVAEYAAKNSIEMIVKKENILIGKTNLDATKDILDIFNKNIKTIKIK